MMRYPWGVLTSPATKAGIVRHTASTKRRFFSISTNESDDILLRKDVPLSTSQVGGGHQKSSYCSVLTLNQPKRYNPLSVKMLQRLEEELNKADAAFPECRTVVIRAAPGNAFSAGHDMKEIHHSLQRNDEVLIRNLFETCARVMESFSTIRPVTIAAVNGIATAAGCQLVAAADLALCTDTSRFAISGITNGLVCSTPLVPLSRNVRHDKHTLAMLLTGTFVSAHQAREYGLVNQVVGHAGASDQHDKEAQEAVLEAATMELVYEISRHSSYAVVRGKELFYQQKDLNITDAYALATERIIDDIINSRDAREGITAFVEKRPAQWGQGGHE